MGIRINAPDVIHESFENESVIVNLRIGIYFSLNDAGLPLWEEISRGATMEQLVETWGKTHGVGEDEARAVTHAFLKELQEEQLIVVDASEALPASVAPIPAGALRPALQKYTDLQDLLMLDPIHDVDERGWPHSKPVDDTPAST
jgi:hypothetical protein